MLRIVTDETENSQLRPFINGKISRFNSLGLESIEYVSGLSVSLRGFNEKIKQLELKYSSLLKIVELIEAATVAGIIIWVVSVIV